MRSMRLRPVLVRGLTGIIGVVGAAGVVTVGTIVPTVLPATAATAAVPDDDASAGAGVGDEPGSGPGADRQPSCGRASDPDFPIDTHIHGGPDEYRPGGPPQSWSIDLTNSTDEACHNIHPVIVLSDRHRSLTAAQVRLQLTDDKGRWRTMSLEKSDEDETIAVLEGGFSGYAVPGRQTVTVRARLAFTAAAATNEVVANAATVQRRGGDGDWVGESNDYHFSVGGKGVGEKGGGTDRDTEPGTGTGEPSRTTGPTPAPAQTPAPNSEEGKDSSPPLGTGALADTGSGSLAGPAIAAGVFVVAGTALIVGLRRPRKRR
ncbi:hypothetical protein [Streptomyces sp. NPDC058595]|uniref:hypothetical protein n=1 Tax=Streptomyces sp. NPDC058595 TaxID=3346550 RepID=UPI0036614E4A